MKGLYRRLFLAYAILLLAVFAGLGVVLGQFFPLVLDSPNDEIQQKYLVFLLSILCVAFILSLLMAARLLKRYTIPIDNITEAALRISKEDFNARIEFTEPGTENELSTAINRIASTLHEMSILRVMEKERLNTLVESMGSALLMIGREGAVNLVNGVFRETFGFTSEQIIKKTYNRIGLPEEITQLIESVFMTEQPSEKQVRLTNGSTSSYVSVYGAPVIGDHGNWLGIVVVMHDITKLVQLEKVRKNFVANVSHELRTPITSIKGFTETLLSGAMHEPEVARDFLQIIQKEGDRLQILIDDLLALSAMESEGFTLKYSTVNLMELINDALNSVSVKIERKKMNLEVDMPSEVLIEGDEGRLMQVMVNLLTNAIMYSKEAKTVKVSVKDYKSYVIIEVKDEGIGIAPSELSRLFERFYRVDRARSRDSGGTGLGLAIVKHLVEAHNGSVVVESALGKGTSFKVQLPRVNS
ncbi:two-component system histidine kinase PnpS [Sporosarcina sp. CAU 1771]